MTTVRCGEAASGARVDQLGQFRHDVGHLVAALAAADVDDDVRGAPLGHLLEQDRLARAEAAGHGGGAAQGDRVEQVEHPLSGHERLAGVDAAAGADVAFARASAAPGARPYAVDDRQYVVLPGTARRRRGRRGATANLRWHEDPQHEGAVGRGRCPVRAGRHWLAGTGPSGGTPTSGSPAGAPRPARASPCPEQRAKQPVEDAPQQGGPECRRQRLAARHRRCRPGARPPVYS